MRGLGLRRLLGCYNGGWYYYGVCDVSAMLVYNKDEEIFGRFPPRVETNRAFEAVLKLEDVGPI